MKKGITAFVLLATVLLLNLACQSYQVGGTLEARENANAMGAFFAVEANEYVENSLVYLHDMYPKTQFISGSGIGYDFTVKIPIDFARDHLSIFPMASFEGRYINTTPKNEEFDLSQILGLGVKFGGGLDISFSRFFYLRGKAQYQPDITTWMNSHPGLRFSVALGYRTDDDPIRWSLTRQRTAQQEAKLARQAEQDKEKAFQQAISSDPNNAQLYYERGNYLYTNKKIVPASALWEKALELDPNYRVETGYMWTPTVASNLGVQSSGNLEFSNFSLFLHLAMLLRDSATGTGNETDNVVSESAKKATLEKALGSFRRGYEIDITGGKNTNRNLRTVYLGYIAHTLDLLGRTQEATASYAELAKVANVTTEINYRVTTTAQNLPSYYVSASGNNNNDGLSEDRPLRSLALASRRAESGSIKRITVIGTLNQQSEGGEDDGCVFPLEGGIATEIVISGKWGLDRAVLSGAGSGKSVVNVSGTTRFEHIEISGGELNAENKHGYGITIFGGTGTIGLGTVVRANKGVGVDILVGTVFLAGGDIRDNEGGGVLNSGTFTMQSGSIRNNKVANGGGVYNTGNFTMSGGVISGNTATEFGGGVFVANSVLGDTVFTMIGGTISNNTAQYGGGVFIAEGAFRQSGGAISSNRARLGGGVFVFSRYDRTGGTVTGNTVTHTSSDAMPGSNANVFRRQGSLGSGW